ncbi:MAG: glutamine--fructose-6-phosphate transaminase (isomerizing) [Clostridia bacterium]|nr:glutamine--fructose-6-phosphate transaminase (isomerizing) [Clostridia bacterium]
MCGIIGYTGRNKAVPYLLTGLERLEYRGYDSSGIALIDESGISVVKRKGKVSALRQAVGDSFTATAGIGHTRWATHGEPSQLNAHPHLSENGMFAVIHNGIIENCSEIKQELKQEGYSFLSDTDTEVISQLLEKNYRGNLITCLKDTLPQLQGSFALAVLHRDFPGTILCAKKDSPLIAAKTEDGCFVLSDTLAAREHISACYIMDDGELALITENSLSFFSADGTPISKEPHFLSDCTAGADKGDFPHFMLKEIYEQPAALRDTLSAYVKEGRIVFPGFFLSEREIKTIDKIHLVACGSAYHAALCSKYIFHQLTDKEASAHIASEFRYDSIPLSENSLVVIISQSGETADSLAALSLANSKGAKTLAVVNVENSSIAMKAQSLICTLAGTEISVATTKAYICQLAVLYLLALYIGTHSGGYAPSELFQQLLSLPEKVEKELLQNERALAAADLLKGSEHIYFIGRGTDYALSMEGALKMKEISYIHCEAYPAGELKHGTISLIEKGTPVVALCLRKDLFRKTLSAIKEVRARGAFVIALTAAETAESLTDCDFVFCIGSAENDILTPFLGAVPLQLMSYHTAVRRGCDVDKPRNLAKSVTVE